MNCERRKIQCLKGKAHHRKNLAVPASLAVLCDIDIAVMLLAKSRTAAPAHQWQPALFLTINSIYTEISNYGKPYQL